MGFKPSISAGAAPVNPPASNGLSKDDKWKLASHVQKAIRHGKVQEAQWAAGELWKLDAAYLRYRLSVIAVEDVAAGNPQAVLEAFQHGWKKAVVDQKGGIDFLIDTIGKFACGPKDRTPCDMMYCTRFQDDFQAHFGDWTQMEWNKACTIALDDAKPWWARGLAAWRCAGTSPFQARTSFLPSQEGDWSRWVQANREAYGDQAADLMRVGEHQREHHPVFIGLAMGQANASLIRPSIPSLPKVGPWLSSALDKHTSEGKRALGILLRNNPQGVAMLAGAGVPMEDQADLVGRLWFWKEGSRCNIERSHALSQAIHPDNRARVLGSLSESVLEEAFGDTAAWQRAREQAMGIALGQPRSTFQAR